MYLIDTNVISEIRKGARANAGVRAFFQDADEKALDLFISAITFGELRRGVDRIRYRGDQRQAERLERWLTTVTDDYRTNILDFTAEEAQVWGRLRVPHPENGIDKQIAATALVYDLPLVTRHVADFSATGVELVNPFRFPGAAR